MAEDAEGDAETSRIAERILDIVNAKPGLTQDEMVGALGNVDGGKLATAINELLSKGYLTMMKSGNSLAFMPVDAAAADKLRGLSAEERLILQHIGDSGVNGIWIRYLKVRLNIPQNKVPKILQTLEKQGGNKRVYMLYDLNPPPKFDFNPEKMSTLLGRTRKFIHQKVQMFNHPNFLICSTYANLEEINGFLQAYVATPDVVAQHGKVDLSQENVQSIVDTLMYDGAVEDFKAPLEQRARRAGATLYKSAPLSVSNLWSSADRMPLGGLTAAPCGTCPVFDKCSDEGDITPRNCPYLAQWFSW